MSFKYLKDQSEKSLLDLSKKLKAGHARRMGNFESHFAMLQRLNAYKSYHISATFDRDVTDPQLLFRALKSILIKNPIMATAGVTQNVPYEVKPRPNDFIKVLDQIKFDDLVWDLRDEVKGLPLNKISENLNHRVLPYEDGKLFWRLGLLGNNTLAFITSHVMHDGISGKNLFQDLAKEFNCEDPIEPVDISNTNLFEYSRDITPESAMPLPAEEATNFIPPKWYYPEFGVNLVVLNWLCDRTPIGTESGSYFHTFNINNDQLAKIKASLAEHSDQGDSKITLTPYIQNAWIHTTTKLSVFENRFGLSGFGIPINSRRFYPSELQTPLYKYGLNIAGCQLPFYAIPKLKWGVIKKLDKHLKNFVNSNKAVHAMGFMVSEKFYKDKHLDIDLPKAGLFNERCGTLLTNIGLMGDPNFVEGGYNIVDGIFSHQFDRSFYDFSIMAVSTKANGLNLVISAPKSTGQERLDEICSEFHRALLSDDIE